MRRQLTVLLAAALTSAVVVAPASATAAPPAGSPRDTVQITGYDFEADRAAYVIAADPNSALRIVYTAGRPITDGTVRVLLSARQWTTALHPVIAFYGSSHLNPADNGGVSVLPAYGLPRGPADCQSLAGTSEDTTPRSWSVDAAAGLQILTVRHVSCAAGQQLTVRIKGIAAPTQPGRQPIVVLTSQPGAPPRITVGEVQVRPVPDVRLSVSIPGPGGIIAGQEFDIVVIPIGPDNLPAAGYVGAVAVVSEPDDCTLTPGHGAIAHEFTGGETSAVSIPVMLARPYAHRLRVYDVTNHAVDGLSSDFDVIDTPADSSFICPASFH